MGSQLWSLGAGSRWHFQWINVCLRRAIGRGVRFGFRYILGIWRRGGYWGFYGNRFCISVAFRNAKILNTLMYTLIYDMTTSCESVHGLLKWRHNVVKHKKSVTCKNDDNMRWNMVRHARV